MPTRIRNLRFRQIRDKRFHIGANGFHFSTAVSLIAARAGVPTPAKWGMVD
jgi:hypothetical protein